MPVPVGKVTSGPDVPTVLNAWTTPTDGFPGSPTVAICTVTTPRFATGTDATEPEPDVVLVVVLSFALDFELLEHAAMPAARAPTSPMSATR